MWQEPGDRQQAGFAVACQPAMLCSHPLCMALPPWQAAAQMGQKQGCDRWIVQVTGRMQEAGGRKQDTLCSRAGPPGTALGHSRRRR